jgi:hypothetical protein
MIFFSSTTGTEGLNFTMMYMSMFIADGLEFVKNKKKYTPDLKFWLLNLKIAWIHERLWIF